MNVPPALVYLSDHGLPVCLLYHFLLKSDYFLQSILLSWRFFLYLI